MINLNSSPILPDPSRLLDKIGLKIPLIGFYDSPDIDLFEPLVKPDKTGHDCVFSFFKQWLNGKTLHLTKDNYGCGGAGHWICGIEGRSREDYLDFLVNNEGLKSSFKLMDKWLDHSKPACIHSNKTNVRKSLQTG